MAYSDTSSGVGIAIWINGWWRAWRLYQGGTKATTTSAGLKQSEWNSSLMRLLLTAWKTHASKFMGTTGVSLKGGGRAAATTMPPTRFSSASMNSQLQPSAPSSPAMFPAHTTPQTAPQEASILQPTSYSPQYSSWQKSKSSSPTSMLPLPLLKDSLKHCEEEIVTG